MHQAAGSLIQPMIVILPYITAFYSDTMPLLVKHTYSSKMDLLGMNGLSTFQTKTAQAEKKCFALDEECIDLGNLDRLDYFDSSSEKVEKRAHQALQF
eukprot:15343304-Ditylum_brightwellii.AAC.1